MKQIKNFIAVVVALVASISTVEATQTSLFWTNCTTKVLEPGTGQLDVDNYFSVWNKRHHGQFFAPDIGIELGLFEWSKIKFEGGFDYVGGTDFPLNFNVKCAVEENVLFCNSPSVSFGCFNIGTRAKGPRDQRTDENIVSFVMGKELPGFWGTFYAGGFNGSRAMGKNHAGFWVGYENYFCKTADCCGEEYDKWGFLADYASGKNTIGGGGFALAYFFAPGICVESGPTWFNSFKHNGSWKWSVQLHIEFPVFDCGRACW